VGCVRLKNFRLSSFLDIKAGTKEGGSKGRISKRLLRPTEIEGVFRPTAKKLGTFSSISLSLQEKVPNNLN